MDNKTKKTEHNFKLWQTELKAKKKSIWYLFISVSVSSVLKGNNFILRVGHGNAQAIGGRRTGWRTWLLDPCTNKV
jgi:hypothetical protein